MTAPATPLTHRELWDAWSRLWNGDFAIADTILSRTMRVNIPQHGMPDPGTLHDGPSVAAWIAAFRSSFDDDARITGELGPFIVGDYAIGRWVFEGTWQGGRPAAATAPAGTPVTFRGVDILRFEDGRIAEYWLSDDQLDLYAQLGVLGDTGAAAQGADPAAELRERLAELPEDAGRKLLLQQVLDAAAEATESAELRTANGDASFLALGVNSLAAVVLGERLGELTGVPLAPTTVFDQPTPRVLADHLWTRLTATADGASVSLAAALARLEAAAAELTGDGADVSLRAELVTRLGALLGRLTPAPAGATAGKPIESTSAEELLAYLDTRLRPLGDAG
ncbi:ester cyclase [Streptomyces marokkonensis]|uniref:Ester cyclase n=1 Tax=Streptomyces marokkonensis TaxID=324855 RepID=A0ABW6QDJ7_9ACTN